MLLVRSWRLGQEFGSCSRCFMVAVVAGVMSAWGVVAGQFRSGRTGSIAWRAPSAQSGLSELTVTVEGMAAKRVDPTTPWSASRWRRSCGKLGAARPSPPARRITARRARTWRPTSSPRCWYRTCSAGPGRRPTPGCGCCWPPSTAWRLSPAAAASGSPTPPPARRRGLPISAETSSDVVRAGQRRGGAAGHAAPPGSALGVAGGFSARKAVEDGGDVPDRAVLDGHVVRGAEVLHPRGVEAVDDRGARLVGQDLGDGRAVDQVDELLGELAVCFGAFDPAAGRVADDIAGQEPCHGSRVAAGQRLRVTLGDLPGFGCGHCQCPSVGALPPPSQAGGIWAAPSAALLLHPRRHI